MALHRSGRFDQRRVRFGRLTCRDREVPAVDERFVGVSPERDSARGLTPRCDDGLVEQRVICPRFLGAVGEAREGIRIVLGCDR